MELSECTNSVACVRECSCLNVGVKLFVLVSAVVCRSSVVCVQECSCLNVGTQLLVLGSAVV